MAAHSHLINQSSPPLSRNRECHDPHALLGITWRARTRDLVKLDITQTETVNRPEGCSDIRRAPWARLCYFDNFTGGRNRRDWELYCNSSLVVVCWCRHEPLPCRSRVWGREALGARQRGLSATPEIEQAWSSSQLWLDTYLLSDQVRVVRSLSTLVSNRLTSSPTAV